MTRFIDHKKMGRGKQDWLDSHFHFSFADYYNPSNMNFGVLRVLNDDLIQPGTGFGKHPHRDMEIISYIINGEISHDDSMGNSSSLTRGQVQYMSAGTGVYHSEYNLGSDVLRLLQIWIIPDKHGYTPDYGDVKFDFSDRIDRWLLIASGQSEEAPVHVNADVNIFAIMLSKDGTSNFSVKKGRQAYLVLIEGSANINDDVLESRDALEVVEEDITIKANTDTHILLIEMAKDNKITV